jgi:hypothetical protein
MAEAEKRPGAGSGVVVPPLAAPIAAMLSSLATIACCLPAGGLRSRKGFSGNRQPERARLCGLGADPHWRLAPAYDADARANSGFACSAILGPGTSDCGGVAPRFRVKCASAQAVLLRGSRALLGYGGDFSTRGARKRHTPSTDFLRGNSCGPGIRYPLQAQRVTFCAESPRAALKLTARLGIKAWRRFRRQAWRQVQWVQQYAASQMQGWS